MFTLSRAQWTSVVEIGLNHMATATGDAVVANPSQFVDLWLQSLDHSVNSFSFDPTWT
jgi:hypothetical protein